MIRSGHSQLSSCLSLVRYKSFTMACKSCVIYHCCPAPSPPLSPVLTLLELHQRFSKRGGHQHHLEGLLHTRRWLGPTPQSFRFSRSEVGFQNSLPTSSQMPLMSGGQTWRTTCCTVLLVFLSEPGDSAQESLHCSSFRPEYSWHYSRCVLFRFCLNIF